jgi:MYND finger
MSDSELIFYNNQTRDEIESLLSKITTIFKTAYSLSSHINKMYEEMKIFVILVHDNEVCTGASYKLQDIIEFYKTNQMFQEHVNNKSPFIIVKWNHKCEAMVVFKNNKYMKEDSKISMTLVNNEKHSSSFKKRFTSVNYGCGQCGSVENNNKFKKCGKCKNVRYCSKECQIKDWSVHKLKCK